MISSEEIITFWPRHMGENKKINGLTIYQIDPLDDFAIDLDADGNAAAETAYEFADEENDYQLAPSELLVQANSPANKLFGLNEAEKRKLVPKIYLSQKNVDRAEHRDKEYGIPHKTMRGTMLRVHAKPSKQKSYVVMYKIGGKTRRHTIGDAAIMSFAEAEEKAYEAKRNIKEYGNPNGARRKEQRWTLDRLFHEYLIDYGHKTLSENWRKQSERYYHQYMEPHMKDTFIGDITKRDLVNCINSAPSIHTRRQIKVVLSSLYSWALDLDYVERNIVRDIRTHEKAPSRKRYLTEVELAAVWSTSFQLNTPFGECARFLILSGQRRTEVAEMEWAELDLKQRQWKIPAHRTKNRCEHTVPLTDGMLELIKQVRNDSDYVFASTRKTDSAINGWSKTAIKWQQSTWVKDWRIHDLRRTVSTHMSKLGIAPHVIDAVENRKSGLIKGVTAIYIRHNFEQEKREALEHWEAHVMELVEKHKDFTPHQEPSEVEL